MISNFYHYMDQASEAIVRIYIVKNEGFKDYKKNFVLIKQPIENSLILEIF